MYRVERKVCPVAIIETNSTVCFSTVDDVGRGGEEIGGSMRRIGRVRVD